MHVRLKCNLLTQASWGNGRSDISGVTPQPYALSLDNSNTTQRTVGFDEAPGSYATQRNRSIEASLAFSEAPLLVNTDLKSLHRTHFSRTVALRPLFRHAKPISVRDWPTCGRSPSAATNEVKQTEIQATAVLYVLPKQKVGSWTFASSFRVKRSFVVHVHMLLPRKLVKLLGH